MSELSFTEFSASDSLSLRREKLNELLNYTKELEQTLSQFSDLFAFIKSTYNSKPYFFSSLDAMTKCKFLQANFTCICLIEVDGETYLRYYKITNSETGASDGSNIIDIISDSTLKAVKIPDLFGIEDLATRVEALESESGGDYSG
jgi:hypothetical protein